MRPPRGWASSRPGKPGGSHFLSTAPEKNAGRPAHIGAGQLWWYTHLGLRRARGTLAGAVKAAHMFAWLTSATAGQNIARTTSPLEGGINVEIKDLIRTHRGLTPDHAARAVDWYLYLRTEQPQDPWQLVHPRHWQP